MMPKWLVGISKANPDKRLIKKLLEELEYNISYGHDDPNPICFWITSYKFEQWNEKQVLDDVDKLITSLKSASQVEDQELDVEYSVILELGEDGRYKHKVFGQATLTQMTSASAVIVTTYGNKHLTEEEIRKLREEQRRRDQENRILKYLRPAILNDNARQVTELLKPELTIFRMYQIYELIEDDLGGKISIIASQNQAKRFRRSANHPEVSGLESRHSVTNNKPPPNPMNLSEMKNFIDRLTEKWFEYILNKDAVKYASSTTLCD